MPDGAETVTEKPPTMTAANADYITPDQVIELEAECFDVGLTVEQLKVAAKVSSVQLILASEFGRAKAWIAKHKKG